MAEPRVMDTSSPPKAAKPAAFSCDAVASSKPISYMLQMKRIWLAPIGLAVLGTRKMALTRTVVIPNIKAGPERSPDRSALTGCPWHDVKALLRQVGLRPTRQRMAFGWILFGKGDRHLTAEMLYEEATHAKGAVSLATVYNTLHQFTEVGLLRQIAVDGSKAYFDTNISTHHHFFIEGDNAVLD